MNISKTGFACHNMLRGLPGDIRNDDPISPEEYIWGLTIMGEVLDIDCLLVQHEDVPGHAVGGLLELAQVDGLALVHLLPRAGEEDEEKEQEGCLWLKLEFTKHMFGLKSTNMFISPF